MDFTEVRQTNKAMVKVAKLYRGAQAELLADLGLHPGQDVLLWVLGQEPEGLLVSELADRLLLSRSGATRLIDRLVTDGLVERASCESDRRGQWAALTPAGYDRLRRAAPTHLRGVAEHFLDRLSADDLAALERMLGSVSEAPE